MSRIVRGALLQAEWTGDKESMIQKHEKAAHDAAQQGAQLVVYRVAADDLAQPAALGRPKAKQTHVIHNGGAERIIGVEAALGVGNGEARACAYILAGVAHVVEQDAVHVLLDGLAQQLTDEPVPHLHFLRRIPFVR